MIKTVTYMCSAQHPFWYQGTRKELHANIVCCWSCKMLYSLTLQLTYALSYNRTIHNRKWAATNQAYLWHNSQVRKDCSTTTITTVSTSSWLKPKLGADCFSAPVSLWTFARCSKPRWMRHSFSPWSCNMFSKPDTASISLRTL